MKNKALPRILPFIVFMGFIGVEGLATYLNDTEFITLNRTDLYYLYPLKALAVTCVLAYLWKYYIEIHWYDLKDLKTFSISVLTGLLIFILWINLDFNIATQGSPSGFNPQHIDNNFTRISMICIRMIGAVILVPVMEELFWRSFLIRYIITSDFNKTAIGHFTWTSFLITAVLFGLEHHYILAGIIAGIIFNLLLYHTKSIAHCILSHAVANLALGIYVLLSGEWRFW